MSCCGWHTPNLSARRELPRCDVDTTSIAHQGLHWLPAQHSALEPHCASGAMQLGPGLGAGPGAGAEWLPKESQARGGLASSERGAAAAPRRLAAERSRLARMRRMVGMCAEERGFVRHHCLVIGRSSRQQSHPAHCHIASAPQPTLCPGIRRRRDDAG